MNEHRPNTELIFKNMAVIWLGIFASQLAFGIVAFAVNPDLLRLDLSAPILGKEPTMVIIFAILGFVLIAASFAMKASFNRKATDTQQPGLVQTGMIVACAMCEAASLFGVVMAFAHSYRFFFIWIAVAMAGMAFHFPSRRALMNASMGRKL